MKVLGKPISEALARVSPVKTVARSEPRSKDIAVVVTFLPAATRQRTREREREKEEEWLFVGWPPEPVNHTLRAAHSRGFARVNGLLWRGRTSGIFEEEVRAGYLFFVMRFFFPAVPRYFGAAYAPAHEKKIARRVVTVFPRRDF